ncbi:MAG: hypothetical protein V4555_12290 [Acidobacteriota bacterium]
MRIIFASAFLLTSVSALAQNADTLYTQACGPKAASFQVDQVQGQPSTSPQPGKALVYVIQQISGPGIVTRIGLDGSWGGVIAGNSYIPLVVSPGEHHLCAATQNTKHPEAQLAHLNAQAGKVYYFLIRCRAADLGNSITMAFDPADRDEALYLIASDRQSVAKPKP